MSVRRIALPLLIVCLLAGGLAMRGWLRSEAQDLPETFRPPDRQARQEAIGSTRALAAEFRAALEPADLFDPIPAPGPSDWLANHRESGQTFAQYLRGRPNRPDQQRNKLYLQPVGTFDPDKSPDLEEMKTFAEAFFQLAVDVLPPLKLDGLPIKSRMREGGLRQFLSTDVLDWCEGKLPDDAYCFLAVTMEDLYPDERWNFVFGQASLNKRVGVYSFARYAPSFYGQPAGDDDRSLVLLRSCKVLAHETGHMFGIKHCIHFHCLMNGSNHLQESDHQPLHTCPVCLRKLQAAVGFDVGDRYGQLHRFSEDAGLDEEADWLKRQLARLPQ